jgi:hypothetical protein
MLAVCDCLFNILAATHHVWRLSLPSPEATAWHGGKGPTLVQTLDRLYVGFMLVNCV